MNRATSGVKLADQVWVITALLHRENPSAADFSIGEIMARARTEPVSQPLRPGFHVHVVQHCVAGRTPNPGRWRMLVETAPGRRRLFRPGDAYDRARQGARSVPDLTALPADYRNLLDWYQRSYTSAGPASTTQTDALLELRDSGRATWADEPGDQYVQRLRQGWT